MSTTMQTASTQLTSAQILVAHSSPIELIPAPGAGKLIVVHRYYLAYASGTPYATNTDFSILYTDASGKSVSENLNLGSATDIVVNKAGLDLSGSPENLQLVNEPLVASVLAGNPTTGTGIIEAIVFYSVIDVSIPEPTLSTPQNFSASPLNANTMNLSWDAVTNAETYIGEMATRADYSDAVEVFQTTSLSAQHGGIIQGTTYYFRLMARAVGHQDSAYATTQNTTPLATMTAPTVAIAQVHDKFSSPRSRSMITADDGTIYFTHVNASLEAKIIDNKNPQNSITALAGNTNEGHHYPVLGIDNAQVLHWVGNMHNDPWQYKKYDLNLSEIPIATGEGLPFYGITYPAFYRSPVTGTLFLAFRFTDPFGGTERFTYPRACAVCKYNVLTKRWTALGGIINHSGLDSIDNVLFWQPFGRDNSGGGSNDGYQPGQAKVIWDDTGRMHLAYAYIDHPGTWLSNCNRATRILYVYSDDDGVTFKTVDGVTVSGTVTPSTPNAIVADILDTGGSMCTGWYHAAPAIIGGKLRIYYISEAFSDQRYIEINTAGNGFNAPVQDQSYNGQMIAGNNIILNSSGGFTVGGQNYGAAGHVSKKNFDLYAFDRIGVIVHKNHNNVDTGGINIITTT